MKRNIEIDVQIRKQKGCSIAPSVFFVCLLKCIDFPTIMIQINEGGKNMQVVGFWKRFAAYLIDSIVLGIVFFLVSIIAMLPMVGVQVTTESEGIIMLSVFLLYAVLIVLQLLYFIVLEASSMQGTIGKKLLGIVVVDEFGERITIKKSIGRTLSKFLLSGIFYIGYIMIGVTEKKQGLHDRIAKTYCVEKDKHNM